ncbi:hypothetical protein JTB14_006238 [Gonioctena quinquepunctata]|nr:hypothetical protein JTB14_006238 [Gonioctena quinquepunctata]
MKKSTTKKQKGLNFLPKIQIETEIPGNKENLSPYIKTSNPEKNQKTSKTPLRNENVENGLPQTELSGVRTKSNNKKSRSAEKPKNLESTPEEKRDSEVEFKKRKKKSNKNKNKANNPPPVEKEQQEVYTEEKNQTSIKSPSFTKKSNSAQNMKNSILKTRKRSKLTESTVDCTKQSISSGDVFVEEILNETFQVDQESKNQRKTMNPEQERKSVRFRNTFEVQNITTDSTLKSTTFEESCREEGSFKRYRKSPHVKKVTSKISSSVEVSKIFNDLDTSKTPGGKTPTKNNKRSTFEMPSPIFGPEVPVHVVKPLPCPGISRGKISVVNLITPSPKKSVCSISEVRKLQRESTFTMDDRTKSHLVMNNAETPPLKLLNKNKVNNTIENNETLGAFDSSKLNGRRRWNKSLGVSFLDSSGKIHNISAPWSEEPIDLSAVMPADSETPNKKRVSSKPANKKHSFRAALLEKKCSTKKNETKKTTKMPNFALIHQRAFDKLENLKEMSERKAVRAQLLLSGLKPTAEVSLKKSPAKSKKLLRYSLRSNISASKVINNSPRVAVTDVELEAPSLSNPKVIPRVQERKIEASHIPKPAKSKFVGEKKGLTKLGFKVGAEGSKKATKQEQVKAIVNKSKVNTNTVENRRNIIHNVRSNRRFDLLMKMRNK